MKILTKIDFAKYFVTQNYKLTKICLRNQVTMACVKYNKYGLFKITNRKNNAILLLVCENYISKYTGRIL